MESSDSTKLLSSVNNAVLILKSFTMDEPQKGVRQLATELGFSKSSVQRILSTLLQHGFVRKNEETNKYELGLSVLELSSIFLKQIDLHKEAMPILMKLANTHRETAHLAILDNLNVVYLAKVESNQSMELISYSGHHIHTHCTSSGKLLLAHSDRYLVDTIIEKGLNKFTSNTITDRQAFLNELSKIKQQGYSVSKGELNSNVSSISVPIRDYSGKVVAAINLVGPTPRFSSSRIRNLTSDLIVAGETISEQLGFWKR